MVDYGADRTGGDAAGRNGAGGSSKAGAFFRRTRFFDPLTSNGDDVVSAVQDAIGEAADRISGTADKIGGRARDAYGQTADRVQGIAARIDPIVQEQPYLAVAFAAAAGLLLGLLIAGRGPKIIYVRPPR